MNVDKEIPKMRSRFSALLFVLAAVATFFLMLEPVSATLGEEESSISSDEIALNGVSRSTANYNGYKVQEIRSEAVALREYVAPDGIVFAITWNGLIHPDLTPLLGSYSREYEDGLKQTPRERGRRRLQLKTNQMIVEKWGHMRNLQGRAYLPALIPPGVTVNDIK
jgi:hypothetical protein